MIDKHNIIGLKIKRLGKALNQQFVERLKACGGEEITMIGGRILGYLENATGDVYQKDIEEKFHINRSSVTSVVKLLERKGYIERVPVPNDARLKKLLITDKGIAVNKCAKEAMFETEKMAMDCLDENEREFFFSCCDKIIASIEKEGKEVEDFD